MKNDIYTKLNSDHEKIKSILSALTETTRQAEKTRTTLFNELKLLVEAHSDAEEATFYEPLKSESDNVDAEILESTAEHATAEELMSKLEYMEVTDEMWLPTLKVLKENLEHHIDEEEEELFPEAKKTFSSVEAKRMGESFSVHRDASL